MNDLLRVHLCDYYFLNNITLKKKYGKTKFELKRYNKYYENILNIKTVKGGWHLWEIILIYKMIISCCTSWITSI